MFKLSTCNNCEKKCEDVVYQDQDNGKFYVSEQVTCPSYQLSGRSTREITKEEYDNILQNK